MKYDIYFHNDFDGRASAAVMLAFLRSRGDDIDRYVAMTYGDIGGWMRNNFFDKGNPAIVVDFTYHPKAAWWFDHHPTAFKKAEWAKRFKPDAQHHLDGSYLSCCHLVYTALKQDFGWVPEKHFQDFVKWMDVIDGARYRSAKQTIEMKEPMIQMNAFIEAMWHTPEEDEKMITLLAERPIAEVIKVPFIARGVKQIKKNVKKSMAFYKKNLKCFDKSTFIDITEDPLHGLLRLAPYYLYPKSIYSGRIKKKGKVWYLGIAANPWRLSSNGWDLGMLMRRYGGGGHMHVAATEFPARGEALKAFGEINAVLNQ